MSKKIIIASNNKGKIKEFSEILSPLGFEIVPQSEAVGEFEAEENGSTFAENAVIKAKAIYDIKKLPVIADDSGLCVDALYGRPGIYSARYASKGEECDKLLSEMENVPDEKRGAYFECAIAFIDDNGVLNVSGKCFGTIAKEKRGTNGFG
jgi:XTP/dITP diphosphohydrolase